VTGATHIAGAVVTMAVARGMGLDVGPLELVVCMAGSLVPDIDTQNAGMGRFLRPVSGFLEKRIGTGPSPTRCSFWAVCGSCYGLSRA